MNILFWVLWFILSIIFLSTVYMWLKRLLDEERENSLK